jgi:hypothetical protein
MSSSYYEISGADRMDLEDALERLTLEEIRGTVADRVDEVLEDLRERKALGVNATTKDSLVDAVLVELRRRLAGSVLSEFVDEIGARGWELLSPARVREVRGRLRIYNAAAESALSKRKRSAKTTRGPRVKKLKET